MEWEDAFLSYLKKLEEKKSQVVFCGDLNVAIRPEEPEDQPEKRGLYG